MTLKVKLKCAKPSWNFHSKTQQGLQQNKTMYVNQIGVYKDIVGSNKIYNEQVNWFMFPFLWSPA